MKKHFVLDGLVYEAKLHNGVSCDGRHTCPMIRVKRVSGPLLHRGVIADTFLYVAEQQAQMLSGLTDSKEEFMNTAMQWCVSSAVEDEFDYPSGLRGLLAQIQETFRKEKVYG